MFGSVVIPAEFRKRNCNYQVFFWGKKTQSIEFRTSVQRLNCSLRLKQIQQAKKRNVLLGNRANITTPVLLN